VKERYWLNFKAGEIRTCTNCHGNNTADQLGRAPVTNQPSALKTLLTEFIARNPDSGIVMSSYEVWAKTAIAPDAPADGDLDDDGLTNLEEFVYGTDPAAQDIDGSETAVPLNSELSEVEGSDRVRLTFTVRSNEGLRVVVEYSNDMSIWSTAAIIEDVGIQTPGDVSVSTLGTTAAQTSAGVQQIEVTENSAISQGERTFYRLQLESL
jgi:hypothetical protein